MIRTLENIMRLVPFALYLMGLSALCVDAYVYATTGVLP